MATMRPTLLGHLLVRPQDGLWARSTRLREIPGFARREGYALTGIVVQVCPDPGDPLPNRLLEQLHLHEVDAVVLSWTGGTPAEQERWAGRVRAEASLRVLILPHQGRADRPARNGIRANQISAGRAPHRDRDPSPIRTPSRAPSPSPTRDPGPDPSPSPSPSPERSVIEGDRQGRLEGRPHLGQRQGEQTLDDNVRAPAGDPDPKRRDTVASRERGQVRHGRFGDGHDRPSR